METEDFFRKENISYVFSTDEGMGSFLAETGDMYSEPIAEREFGREWAWNFLSGRYVITIYQRHSVFQDGKRVFLNGMYVDTVGEYSRHVRPVFAVVLDTEQEYSVPTWTRPLTSHFIMSELEPLQVKVYSLKDAEKIARDHSLSGHKAAVLEWYEDHDMY